MRTSTSPSGCWRRSPPDPLTPSLYGALAEWWPLLSAPEDYAEEAEFVRGLALRHSAIPLQTVLDLGSGGGNNASHLKSHFELTLVDLSPGMLEVSRRLNADCEHVEGDMRSVRLGRTFDGVFVHDAVMYLTEAEELRQAMETAFVHLRPGGVAVFVPDHVRETFEPATDHGGHDGDGRAMRYLEWTYDPDPSDTTYVVDYAFLLRDADGSVTVEHDRHVNGLFPKRQWLRLFDETGFRASSVTDRWGREVFVGEKPA
jgi:SAM-dependent methyltransferase